ncbi:hypothetical protein B0H13DRAFT_772213 [Mycena leptocephala]|nr:hypothetical protein B0H13DRAFT_772213 [Mycena leptocephala]
MSAFCFVLRGNAGRLRIVNISIRGTLPSVIALVPPPPPYPTPPQSLACHPPRTRPRSSSSRYSLPSCSTPARLLLRSQLLCIPAGLSKSGTLWSGPGSVPRILNPTYARCSLGRIVFTYWMCMPHGGRHIPPRIPRLVYARCSAARSLHLVLAEADVRLASSPRGAPFRTRGPHEREKGEGRRDGETSSPMCEATHSRRAGSPQLLVTQDDGFLASPPRCLSCSKSACAGDDKWLCVPRFPVRRPRAAPPIVASSRVSGHVLVPRPPPVVTAGSNTRKAEMGECRNGEHSLLTDTIFDLESSIETRAFFPFG